MGLSWGSHSGRRGWWSGPSRFPYWERRALNLEVKAGDFKIVDGKYVKFKGGRGCSLSRWNLRIIV